MRHRPRTQVSHALTGGVGEENKFHYDVNANKQRNKTWPLSGILPFKMLLGCIRNYESQKSELLLFTVILKKSLNAVSMLMESYLISPSTSNDFKKESVQANNLID